MRRVIQFSTGNVGRHSLRAIVGRPDLELVGVHASNPAKIGRDAAELCGLDQPTGILATDDIDALLELGADCVVYTSRGEARPMEAIEQMAKFLAAGTNVVGTSMVWLVAPRYADDWLREPLERACQAGNSSLYVNGIDPGYSGDTLVHTALSLVTRATSIKVQEIFDYGNYDDAEFTGAAMGFGRTVDDDPPLAFLPGVIMSMWGGQVRSLADDLGIELDEVRERSERWFTPEHIDCIMMTVEPGGMAAVRFCHRGRSRQRTGDHPRARHQAHLRRSARLGVSARGSHPCAPRRCGGRAVGGDQHPRFPSGSRFHRCRVHLDCGSGGQRDRLGVPRPQMVDRRGGHSAECDHPWPDVVGQPATFAAATSYVRGDES